jgi:hypothetical protein
MGFVIERLPFDFRAGCHNGVETWGHDDASSLAAHAAESRSERETDGEEQSGVILASRSATKKQKGPDRLVRPLL